MRIKKMDIYKQVADNLNAKGKLPFSAREWSTGLIQQTVYGKLNYPEVLEELRSVMIENNYEDWTDNQFRQIKNEKSEA
jgi:hypothetical protein